MIIQHCRLNLNPSNVKPIVAVSQYDTARQIVFHLYEDDTEYTPQTGASAKVLIGTEQLEGTISGSTVTFEINENLTRNEISKFGEVVIYGDGKVSTCNFIFRVYFTPLGEQPSPEPIPDRRMQNRALSIILGRTVETPDAEEALNILMR